MELAREVQRSFLPLRPPEVAGYEFFAHYAAALEVGGDFYDFIPLPQQRLAAIVGDVAGKGVPAALLMAKLSSDARFCMLTEPNAATAVTRLNASFHQAGLTERFVTLALAVLDPATHTVTLVVAGHPSPLIYRSATSQCEEAVPPEVAGLPISVEDGHEYRSCQVCLEPGDRVLIFSDGVTDAMDRNDEPFRLQGICAALRDKDLAPRAMGQFLIRTVEHHAAGRSQHDDVTLVCFGRTSG
jgi:serine phosphatase RsbU (regulator of sigma subunit)